GPDAGPVAAALGAVPLRELASTTADIEACAVAVGLAAAGRHGVGFEVGAGAPGASLRLVAALGLLALVLGALDLGLVRYDLSRRDAALRAPIARTAGDALPGPPFRTSGTADEQRGTVAGRGVEFRLRAARRPSGASS